MPTQWGRKETLIWPPHSPIYTYGAMFLAVVLTGAFMYMRFAYALTPLQQFYTPIYVRSSLAAELGKTRKDKYRMLFEAGRNVTAKPAAEADVTAGVTEQPGAKSIQLTLTDAAGRQGFISLYRGVETSYFDVPLRDYLRQSIYGGSTLWDIYNQPLGFGLLAFLAQLPFSIRKDMKRRRELKYGRRLKGPVLLTPKQFNGTIAGEGIGFKTTEAKDLMRVPSRYEAQHIELMGDTGAGKTTLIMQILRQIQGRGHTAIVYDPACEFIQRFYDESRGDIVLNPLDKRCPYWGPAEELRSKAEAKTLAKSLYQPTDTQKDEFFTKTPQKIFRKAQLETIYGHLAEVMLSQPATKIFLKTTEPKAAEWVSNAIGKVEIERMKETHFDGTRNGKNFTIDRQAEPLVLDSEISGLEDRRAYLKLGNNVARFAFDYLDLPVVAQDFDRRAVADDELDYDPQRMSKAIVPPSPAVDLEEDEAPHIPAPPPTTETPIAAAAQVEVPRPEPAMPPPPPGDLSTPIFPQFVAAGDGRFEHE